MPSFSASLPRLGRLVSARCTPSHHYYSSVSLISPITFLPTIGRSWQASNSNLPWGHGKERRHAMPARIPTGFSFPSSRRAVPWSAGAKKFVSIRNTNPVILPEISVRQFKAILDLLFTEISERNHVL